MRCRPKRAILAHQPPGLGAAAADAWERQRYLRGMIAWVGLKQVPFIYDRAARVNGRSNYPLSRMLHFALDGVTGFSVVPLRLSLWLSIGCGVFVFCNADLCRFVVAFSSTPSAAGPASPA